MSIFTEYLKVPVFLKQFRQCTGENPGQKALLILADFGLSSGLAFCNIDLPKKKVVMPVN